MSVSPPSFTMTLLSSFINLDSPLSLYSIPVVYFTSFYPTTLKVCIFSFIAKERIFHIATSSSRLTKLLDTTSASNFLVRNIEGRDANIHLSVQPRSNTSKVANDKNISPELAARIQRMEGAHLNGNEAFPLWVAAIVSVLRRVSKRVWYLMIYKHEARGKLCRP